MAARTLDELLEYGLTPESVAAMAGGDAAVEATGLPRMPLAKATAPGTGAVRANVPAESVSGSSTHRVAGPGPAFSVSDLPTDIPVTEPGQGGGRPLIARTPVPESPLVDRAPERTYPTAAPSQLRSVAPVAARDVDPEWVKAVAEQAARRDRAERYMAPAELSSAFFQRRIPQTNFEPYIAEPMKQLEATQAARRSAQEIAGLQQQQGIDEQTTLGKAESAARAQVGAGQAATALAKSGMPGVGESVEPEAARILEPRLDEAAKAREAQYKTAQGVEVDEAQLAELKRWHDMQAALDRQKGAAPGAVHYKTDPETGLEHIVDPATGQPMPEPIQFGGAPTGDQAVEMRNRKKFLNPEEQNKLSKAEGLIATMPSIIAKAKAQPGAFSDVNVLVGAIPGLGGPLRTRNMTKPQLGAYSAVFAQASAVIKDLSGAAVSASEKARLDKFLPNETDNLNSIVVKLQGALELADQIRAETQAKVPRKEGRAAPATEAPRSAGSTAGGKVYEIRLHGEPSGKTVTLGPGETPESVLPEVYKRYGAGATIHYVGGR